MCPPNHYKAMLCTTLSVCRYRTTCVSLVHHGAHSSSVVHNRGCWCTTWSCTVEVVHNVDLTIPVSAHTHTQMVPILLPHVGGNKLTAQYGSPGMVRSELTDASWLRIMADPDRNINVCPFRIPWEVASSRLSLPRNMSNLRRVFSH